MRMGRFLNAFLTADSAAGRVGISTTLTNSSGPLLRGTRFACVQNFVLAREVADAFCCERVDVRYGDLELNKPPSNRT